MSCYLSLAVSEELEHTINISFGEKWHLSIWFYHILLPSNVASNLGLRLTRYLPKWRDSSEKKTLCPHPCYSIRYSSNVKQHYLYWWKKEMINVKSLRRRDIRWNLLSQETSFYYHFRFKSIFFAWFFFSLDQYSLCAERCLLMVLKPTALNDVSYPKCSSPKDL